jgi:NitT/TauT family transport system permease protein
MLGLFISALIGIPAGLLIGSTPWIYESTRFVIDLMRSKPTIALLPVLVLLFGASFKMKVIIIVLAATWPILIQSAYGARRLEPTVRDMLRSYQIPRWLQFTQVVLPNALPFIATGLRLATALCILVAVGAELLASVAGMGYEISLARNDGASAVVLAYVVACGLLGLSANTIFSFVERMVLSWHPSVRGELP